MNERNDFDDLLRSHLEGVVEPAPDVWEGIVRGLERHRRAVIFRRFSVGVAAAAAGLAVAWLVMRGPQAGEPLSAPVLTAHHVDVTEPAPAPSAEDAMEIAPIAAQIAAFTRNRAVADAGKVETPSVEEVTPVRTDKDTAPEATTPDESQVTVPAEDPQKMLSEEDLPTDYWREDTPAREHVHTSQITILSNLTAVASENDLIYRASPSHSSSQSGNRQASSPVEPLSGTPKFYSPLSVGLQISKSLSGRVSVATGLRYTYLVSQYDILVNKEQFQGAYNQLHYLGIPLEVSYHIVQTGSFGFYATAGGAAEKCISQRYVYGSNTLREKVGGLQWSARVGLGAEYWFVPRAGVYFDPGLVYYFDNKQPLSIRTQQPLEARFEIGLRFKL
ncbi:MAG: hypothetical protein IJ636_07985 [Bacteroidales bacterium]|nr:hypothetical protein [Bacteroidales bacterium]